MIRIDKRLPAIDQLLKAGYQNRSIEVYFANKIAVDGFDKYEKRYSDVNFDMKVIKETFIRQVTAERLVYKQYGLKEIGALEILCDARYTEYFKLASKIVIENEEYEIYKDGLGDRTLIEKRPFNLIRVTITKKGNNGLLQ